MQFPVELAGFASALLEASWNGIPFYMPDSRHETGRRVRRFFFPGQDQTAFQDLGAFDGPMHITGLMVGDRYAHYGRLIDAAMRQPGPGTLVHPWLGELQMVLVRPARIVFSQRQMRVVSFEAEFAPFYPNTPSPSTTLDALLDQVDVMQAQVQDMLASALAPVGTAILIAEGVVGYAQALGTWWSGNVQPSPQAGNVLAAATTGPIAALAGVGAIPAGSGYAQGVYAALAGVPQAVAETSAALQPQAVGPGDVVPATTPLDGRVTMAVLLAGAAQAATGTGTGGAPGALALAESVLCAAAAVQAATTIAWESAQEAEAALAQLVAALDTAATAAALAAASSPSCGLVWRALEATRAALVADMSATVGRLPVVLTVQAQVSLPAWIIANDLAGDTPGLVVPLLVDLVRRNGVQNPALVPPGPLEVLQQVSAVLAL